jgi:hypothetical protein
VFLTVRDIRLRQRGAGSCRCPAGDGARDVVVEGRRGGRPAGARGRASPARSCTRLHASSAAGASPPSPFSPAASPATAQDRNHRRHRVPPACRPASEQPTGVEGPALPTPHLKAIVDVAVEPGSGPTPASARDGRARPRCAAPGSPSRANVATRSSREALRRDRDHNRDRRLRPGGSLLRFAGMAPGGTSSAA